MAPKPPTYPRGAKGLKRSGDPDVPVTRWAPNGIQLQPFDVRIFHHRGCFFPAPSKLSHVETFDSADEPGDAPEHHDATLDENHDQQSIVLPPVAGQQPADYYGPASNYAGSISSDSDSDSDSTSRNDDASYAVEADTDSDPAFSSCDGAFATEAGEHDADGDDDAMSVDLDDEGFGILPAGLDEPQLKLRPASTAQMLDIMHAATDELNHDHVISFRHSRHLPPLPEGYEFIVTPTMAFCRKPYLILPVNSARSNRIRKDDHYDHEEATPL
ncbi:uncharacterized protein BKCO1_1000186 [Diplodia corticola]|uniref:Uncharacterized protein n=1 Tax=Diplodia corticola TaxID=236234 RepID=A0A1J9RK27_9PEZI|nr:uncharacterized protein BKCO1_1000186 [Diplodia corticola]OJD40346.1 hypothetical protein BKCO1_1000186 [Diplodia corticola]